MLLIVSGIVILIGIWAGPLHVVIQVPPDSSLFQARGEFEDLPLQEADAIRLRAMIDEGIRRNRNEIKRLSSVLDSIYISLFSLGCAGLVFGIYGARSKATQAEQGVARNRLLASNFDPTSPVRGSEDKNVRLE
ncbi:MAG: hypothetical protein ABIS50_00650 [Luteolibacter sp.]